MYPPRKKSTVALSRFLKNFDDGFTSKKIHSSNDLKGRSQISKNTSTGPQIGTAKAERKGNMSIP